MAHQQSAARDAAKALKTGKIALTAGGKSHPLVGVAIGRGNSEAFNPVNSCLPECGHPVSVSKIVATTGRVPGIPCSIGFFESSKYSRKWIISINRELKFWRSQLMLPPLVETFHGSLRATTNKRAQDAKKQIYRELSGRSTHR